NIDVAIRGRHPGNDNFVARKIASFRFGLFASPDFARRCEGAILDEKPMDFRGPFEHGSHASGASSSNRSVLSRSAPGIATNCFALLKQLALDGAGTAILPAHMCDVEVAEGRLVEIEADFPALAEAGLFVVYPSRKDIQTRVRGFS